jgi:hypothetical protein
VAHTQNVGDLDKAAYWKQKLIADYPNLFDQALPELSASPTDRVYLAQREHYYDGLSKGRGFRRNSPAPPEQWHDQPAPRARFGAVPPPACSALAPSSPAILGKTNFVVDPAWGPAGLSRRLPLPRVPALLLLRAPAPLLHSPPARSPGAPLVLYGLFLGSGNSACSSTRCAADITPGLASLVIQAQVFLTIGLFGLDLPASP